MIKVVDRKLIQMEAKYELARRKFFFYCNLKAPKFYKQNRKYLVDLCNTFQDFYEGTDDVLIINLPPRHGKSRTASLLVEWILGNNKEEKIITGSYNETLSMTFSKSIRNDIMETKADDSIPVFSDVFPNTKIKRGDGSMNLWSLEGGYNNYLATSPSGTVTGFGATCFPKGTIIYTDRGPMPIEKIFNDKNCIRALSYNHKYGMIRYNKIEAKRRVISNGFIELTTNTGRKIKSTPEHRYYTREKGYIEAKYIKEGYTVKTAKIQREMCTMWEAENWQRETMFRLLQQEQNYKNQYEMFLLWQRISSFKIPVRKDDKKRVQKQLLYKRMFMQSKRRKAKNQNMSNMWGICSEGQKVLFRRVQKNRAKKCKRIKKYNMSNMQKRIQTSFSQNSILFDGMQKQSSFFKNERERKFLLQRWNKLYKRVSRYKAINKRKRQLYLSDMWRKRTSDETSKIWRNNQFKSSSYRRRYNKQFRIKSNNIMSSMPYEITQDEKIIDINYISEKDFVYDLQVENDNNFFANGVLVHNCLIIDDIIKNAEEANNENVKEKHWNWFTNTMLSRLEEGGKIIIIMTRWASDDLAGKVLDWCSEKNKKYKHISMKALLDKDTKQMLCSDVLSYESYLDKISIMGEDIASANYQQEPIDLKGCLYTKLKTYTDIPEFEQIKSYTDTADTGADYLCSIVYGVYRQEAYVIDVLYTQAGMDVTEDMVADMFYRTGCNIANIESNSGGMSFARNIKRILKEKYDTNRCIIKPFHNSKNKNSRIFSNSAWVMEHIYFPHNWRDKWPEYYKAMISYQRAGKNKHDDAPDATTGIAEFCNKGISVFK